MGGKHGKPGSLNQRNIERLRALVNEEFTGEEISKWYERYNESREGGHQELTKEAFNKVYKEMFTGDSTDFVDHIFRTFDTNKNGTVDFREFLVGLCVSGSSDPIVRLNWAFNMYDIDRDKHITKDEMTSIISAVCKMTNDDSILDELESACFSDNNNQISDGLKDGGTIRDRMERLNLITDLVFKKFDTNNDEKISLEEFRDGVGSLPIVMNLLGTDDQTEEDD